MVLAVMMITAGCLRAQDLKYPGAVAGWRSILERYWLKGIVEMKSFSPPGMEIEKKISGRRDYVLLTALA